MKRYKIQQTFETLGDPAEFYADTKDAAHSLWINLRMLIAEMVAKWPTDEHAKQTTGFAHEIVAWKNADRIAGVKFDETGKRTSDSPTVYGKEAGHYIAKCAVEITEEETD